MSDLIQAAIEKAEEAFRVAILHEAENERGFDNCKHNPCPIQAEARAAIRSLAALVREYGHKARCLCHGWAEAYAGSDDCDWRFGGNTPCGFKHKGEMYRDPCCLPESREEKP